MTKNVLTNIFFIFGSKKVKKGRPTDQIFFEAVKGNKLILFYLGLRSIRLSIFTGTERIGSDRNGNGKCQFDKFRTVEDMPATFYCYMVHRRQINYLCSGAIKTTPIAQF